MTRIEIAAERAQETFDQPPFDCWISPGGACLAEFHRCEDKVLMRFEGEADFLVAPAADQVTAIPCAGIADGHIRKLLSNSVLPALGNHRGHLFLHGSANAIGDGAVCFLGVSRSGKTTLAGALAKAGNPYLTEDAIELREGHMVQPRPDGLRLFHDSAAFMGAPKPQDAEDGKITLDGLPAATAAKPLSAIFVLGSDPDAALDISRQGAGEALAAILPHAFVLDVEDRSAMRGHFERMADLAARVPIHTLNYPRDYTALPEVIAAIIGATRRSTP